MEFVGLPKIARLSREMIITEKIDGTNGQIFIPDPPCRAGFLVGSRTQWITPEKDNHGFAKWCYQRIDELIEGLGPGRHFGEWWGQGINRGYGLKEKRFSLFNVTRWAPFGAEPGEKQKVLPKCCSLVPILYKGPFSLITIDNYLLWLKEVGSMAACNFKPAEGVVIYHTAANMCLKKTIEKDDVRKGGTE